jgi:hypothetical protein
MEKKIKWFSITLPEEVLLSIIADYEYWAKQLSSVISSNKDMAHMMEYEAIAQSLKEQIKDGIFDEVTIEPITEKG